MANEIGGKHVLQLGEEDFNTHLSVEAIRQSYHSLNFNWIQQGRLSCRRKQVKEAKHP